MEPHREDTTANATVNVEMMTPSDRFIGLTKTQFLGIICSMLMAIFLAQAWQLYKTSDLASKTHALAVQNQRQIVQGATARQALCALRANVLHHRDDSVKFLTLTIDQRVAKYGEIGRTPEAVIIKDIKNQNDTLRALRGLNC